MDQTKVHIVIVPTWAMGHIMPLVEFAKRLVHLHNSFFFTFILPNDHPPSNAQKALFEALPKTAFNVILLPMVTFVDLPENARPETVISLTVSRSLPSLRTVFKSTFTDQNIHPAAFVFDFFATDTIEVAKEFNVPPYLFYPLPAMVLSLFLHLEELDQVIPGNFRDWPDPIQIPGCIPIHGRDLLDALHDRKNDAYKWVRHHAKMYRLAEGIIVNSFMDVEGGALRALQETRVAPVYPIGPITKRDPSCEVDGSGCLNWLDDQPIGSVLFVSFGSYGILSHDQTNELALGLEMSGHRFLWVVRNPNDKFGTYSNDEESNKEPFDFLPKGFLARTKGKGFFVSTWAPQYQILSHASTGGFLTQCGWNSCQEGILSGLPLIALPLHLEQKMIAALLTEDVKVALRLKVDENGLVGREETANVVKGLMEGTTLRDRVKDLKNAAAMALSEDGSSTKSLNELASKWKKNQKTI